jgi:Rha family phage regulatory protein
VLPVAAFDAKPKLTADGDRIVTDSRDVAEFFGKRHDNVVRDIREIIVNSPKTPLLNFFRNDQRREMPRFTMTRDGF